MMPRIGKSCRIAEPVDGRVEAKLCEYCNTWDDGILSLMLEVVAWGPAGLRDGEG